MTEMGPDETLKVERGLLKKSGGVVEVIAVRQGDRTLLAFELGELPEAETVARALLRLAAEWRVEAKKESPRFSGLVLLSFVDSFSPGLSPEKRAPPRKSGAVDW